MKTLKREIGDYGERVAVKYLEKKGYTILERNYLKKTGEIDIIAKKDDIISFIEVKTRKNFQNSYASEAVNYYKQQRIIKTAQNYIVEKNYLDLKLSFDVCEVYTEIKKIKFIENAF
ncbi:MAG: YraN family protein [Tissierellia bacterium]|nr:YraN family protein [Tissierellia bacterium]